MSFDIDKPRQDCVFACVGLKWGILAIVTLWAKAFSSFGNISEPVTACISAVMGDRL
jgi:hypothetical protein